MAAGRAQVDVAPRLGVVGAGSAVPAGSRACVVGRGCAVDVAGGGRRREVSLLALLPT